MKIKSLVVIGLITVLIGLSWFGFASALFPIDDIDLPGGGSDQGIIADSCLDDSYCATGLYCQSGVCVECIDDSECSSGESCNYLTCVDSDGNAGGEWCLRDYQCASEVCDDDGTCAPVESVDDEGGGGGGGGEFDWTGIDLTIEDVFAIITGLACWLLRAATAIMVIFLVIAGLRFMAAQGNPTRYEGAKKNFRQVLIGIIVIMAVYVIIATVANAVGRTDFSLIPLIC